MRENDRKLLNITFVVNIFFIVQLVSGLTNEKERFSFGIRILQLICILA